MIAAIGGRMIWTILAAATTMMPLPTNMPDMNVLELSKDMIWVADAEPRVVDGVNMFASITILGSRITGDPSAPVIAASLEMVNCKTNQWKSPRAWFYTLDGKPLEGTESLSEWTTVKAGTKGMRIVEAACGRAALPQLPAMPFKTLVATYQKYRATR